MLFIVDSEIKRGRELSDIFRWMGILSLVKKPMDALKELKVSTNALLLVNPYEMADCVDYVKKVHSYLKRLPVFALCDDIERLEAGEVFDGVFSSSAMTSTLVAGIREAQRARSRALLGDYKLVGVDASCTHEEVRYAGNKIHLTAKEKLILRYLIATYPKRVSASEISSNIYRMGCEPEESCIRAHICAINKKFMPYLLRPLIDALRSCGYRIVTPEILSRRAMGMID